MSTMPIAAAAADCCPRCASPIRLEQWHDLTVRRHRDGRLEIIGCSACPPAAPPATTSAAAAAPASG